MKIDIASVPEIATRVGIHGSAKKREVGGAMCIAAVISIAIVASGATYE